MVELRQRVDDALEQARPILEGFPWADREAYAMWLVQTYHMVSHSTRLAALAAAYATQGREMLHNRFVDHAREERGHPQWCLDDLAVLGKRPQDYPCLYQSAALYQIQYYWIQHRGATSLLGYILSLECLAEKFGRDVVAKVAEAHTDQPTRFLQGHAQADIEHVEKAFEQINALADEERALIWENFELSANLYQGMLKEIPRYLAARGQCGA